MAGQLDFNHQISGTRDWYPSTLFDPKYSNYAVVIMSRPILWEGDLMLSVWEKARLTVTVNGGTYKWIHYLEQMGIDIFNHHPQYVPNIIITKEVERSTPPHRATILAKLQSLGSMIIYVSGQNSTEFVRPLQQIAHCARCFDMNLKEMYVFAQTIAYNDTMTRTTKTLELTNGIVFGTRLIMVSQTYFTWVLHSGRHRIHVPETQFSPEFSLRPECGIQVFDNCTQLRVTTRGLEENCTNASAEDLLENVLYTTYKERVVTINTDGPIQWYNGVITLGQDVSDREDTSDEEDSVDM